MASKQDQGSAAVDAYLAALPDDSRFALEHLRGVIRSAAPQATEAISYQMPAFKQGERFLVSYAAFKDHCSLFPASYAVMEALASELRAYVSGKGTLRFTVEEPIPDMVVTRIVQLRLEEVAAAVAARRGGPGGTSKSRG
jgi:uncharacterized protein YdhG (YjbR/CyaY superfamily)